MENVIRLSPFDEVLPYCPFCGSLPVVRPCKHLKSFIIAQDPEEGDSNLVYLSDDFLAILRSGLGVDIRLQSDPESPDINKRLYEEYYFHDSSDVSDSMHLVDLANSFEGSVTFQQKVGDDLQRFITFALNREEYQEYNQFDEIQKKRLDQNNSSDNQRTLEQLIVKNDAERLCLNLDESDIIEFKQTFAKDTRTQQTSPDIKFACIREIVGFLNTSGGRLLIGIHDKTKEIIGVEEDGYKGDNDKYSLQIMNLLVSCAGETAASLVKVHFETYEAKTICIITCKKSDEPIYCSHKGGIAAPYVRYGSSTKQPDYPEWEKFQRQYFRGRVQDL